MSVKAKWVLDKAHSEIGFKVRHLMISNVSGVFKTYDASIHTIGEDFLTADVDFWMDPASIDTRDENRNKHLRSADFFDTDRHKEITFRSDSVTGDGKSNQYEVWGILTIKGISKKIKLHVTFEGLAVDPSGARKAGFEITGDVSRKDWDIQWNTPLETGGVLVGDNVRIQCEVQLIEAAERNDSNE